MSSLHTPGPWRVMRRANQTGILSTLVVGRANVPVCEPKNADDADVLAAAKDYHAATDEVLAACKLLSGTSAAHCGRLLVAIGRLRAAHCKANGSAS